MRAWMGGGGWGVGVISSSFPPTAKFHGTAPPPGASRQGTELLPSTDITGHF